jgi:hypothetical protein
MNFVPGTGTASGTGATSGRQIPTVKRQNLEVTNLIRALTLIS